MTHNTDQRGAQKDKFIVTQSGDGYSVRPNKRGARPSIGDFPFTPEGKESAELLRNNLNKGVANV